MILIRADANEVIGAGHIMRCLSIAHAFAKRGEKVTFVTADHRGDELIQLNNLSCICLNSEWIDMNGELDSMIKLIEESKPSLLLVDSYYVTNKYLSSLSECARTVYIDDLNVAKWNVDVLINYNIYSFLLNYTAYEGTRTKLLLGPKYVPLRDEFKNSPKHEIRSVGDILVSAGGADPERLTEKLIKNICPRYNDVTFHFAVGALNPRLEIIRALSKENGNVVLHVNEKHMSDLMRNCDVAISAAGTTLYELCSTGIPTIIYTLANNQLMAAEQFDVQAIMLYAGDCRGNDGFVESIERLLRRLIKDDILRTDISTRMQEFADGYGADRIAEELL